MKKKYYLIIYDVVENKKRAKLAKLLCGYGYRIQKSAFEAKLNKQQYEKLVNELRYYEMQGDSVRVYEISKEKGMMIFGKPEQNCCFDEVIVV